VDDVTTTGTPISGTLSPQLLISIFYPGTPLHDGAVILRGNELVAAACVLPLSDNSRISSSLHTRHRAALGLAEKTDAAVLVVSEETGNISLAYDGRLLTALRPEVVRDKLLGLLQRDEGQERTRSGGDGPSNGKPGKNKPGKGQAEGEAPRRKVGVAAARGLLDLVHRAVGYCGRLKGETTD
jgi:diadenylate cyclase